MAPAHRLAAALGAAVLGVALAGTRLSGQTLRITTAIAGAPPTAVQADGVYTFSRTGNACPYRLMASLSAAMPAGVVLTASTAAPAAGSTSTGAQTLSTTPVALATNVPCRVDIANRTITYRLTATSAAGRLAAATRTVTLQIM